MLELTEALEPGEKLYCVSVKFDESNPMNSVGGIQAFAALKDLGRVLKTNPDYLFVVDRNVIAKSKETAAAALDNPLIAKTKAAQNGKIIYLDPELWYLAGGGGLISLKAMSDEVFEAIK